MLNSCHTTPLCLNSMGSKFGITESVAIISSSIPCLKQFLAMCLRLNISSPVTLLQQVVLNDLRMSQTQMKSIINVTILYDLDSSKNANYSNELISGSVIESMLAIVAIKISHPSLTFEQPRSMHLGLFFTFYFGRSCSR